VTIPYNSKIVKAVVEFTGYSPADGLDTDVQCHFEDADNSSAPADKADLDTRVLTSGVPWENIEEWKDNYAYQTPQLRDILQGVINRAGWVSGNNILFTAKNDGLDSYRLWSAIEHRGGLERARLRVSWIAPKKLDPPVIEPVETFQVGSFSCSIRAFPTDASIYYTLDGSNPNTNDILYSAPFQIAASKEVRARAYKDYWAYSDIASRDYTLYTVDNYDYQHDPFSYVSMGSIYHSPELGWQHFHGSYRFVNVSMPQGSIISSAVIRFVTYSQGNYYPQALTLYAENVDNSSQITTLGQFLYQWVNRTTGTPYSHPGGSGDTAVYINITQEIQEIINRGGWASGNALTVFAKGEDGLTYPPGIWYRSHRTNVDAQLAVVWDTGSTTFLVVYGQGNYSSLREIIE